jgi:hypothetical protein
MADRLMLRLASQKPAIRWAIGNSVDGPGLGRIAAKRCFRGPSAGIDFGDSEIGTLCAFGVPTEV